MDMRLGGGFIYHGKSDLLANSFEGEVNYRLTDKWATSLSIGLGKSEGGEYASSNYVLSNLNGYFSPFKNTNKTDFRIGTGFSVMKISNAKISSYRIEDGYYIPNTYGFYKNRRFGFNLVVENTIKLTENLLLGIRIQNQTYLEEGNNTGLQLKFGFRM
ncbi:hypothetical protein GCM10025777_53280 [Membranihabitans marinus]